MHYVFNKSCVGYLHVKNNKPCQDFSASYQDNERIIITCCDGHGGAQYVRSQLGSKAASDAVLSVFKSINRSFTFGKNIEEIQEKIKLLVLCEYNKLIEREVVKNPIKSKEIENLREDQIDALRFNPAKAYGTTLTGAMLYKNRIYVVSIGDTEALGIKRGELVKIFDNTNDPAGNITYSMCQEDVFSYLRVAILPANAVDGILLCTDGLSSPYQSYENFRNSFIKPMVKRLLMSKSYSNVNKTIQQIADKQGIGDDVSLSFFINEESKLSLYR